MRTVPGQHNPTIPEVCDAATTSSGRITREHVLGACRDRAIPIKDGRIPRDRLADAMLGAQSIRKGTA